jgi:hypothetical protein
MAGREDGRRRQYKSRGSIVAILHGGVMIPDRLVNECLLVDHRGVEIRALFTCLRPVGFFERWRLPERVQVVFVMSGDHIQDIERCLS